ncbi:MAG TPA: hypothetical protein VHR15_19015 [Ktedonobacterales bacterium]|jgi:hypothetical protein|nr:hypothetical protein [Ktedonobacterales bacterium]
MNSKNSNRNDSEPASHHPADDDELEEQEDSAFDPAEYDSLLQLERLESLEEDMVELGVTTLDEVRQRIAALHREVDAEE